MTWRFGRGAAFVGGVAAGAVVAGAATSAARAGYYYGAPTWFKEDGTVKEQFSSFKIKKELL